MNWSKHIWMESKFTWTNSKKKDVFSNIHHTWTEFMIDGRFNVKLKNMAEANKISLKIYRTACRFVPTLLNK